MTTNKKESRPQSLEPRVSTLITSDMVLDLYAKAKKLKGTEKKGLMEKVIYLSQHLNRYVPIVVSQYRA
jgi:hypothetical protein